MIGYETFAQIADAVTDQLCAVGSSSKALTVTFPGMEFSPLGWIWSITTSVSWFGSLPVTPPEWWPPDPITCATGASGVSGLQLVFASSAVR